MRDSDVSGAGRGVRLSDGEETVIVRAGLPMSLVEHLDAYIADKNRGLDKKEKTDRSKTIRDFIKAQLLILPENCSKNP